MAESHYARSQTRSARIALFLLAAGYLATLCPFYAVRHHAWIFAFLPGLLLLKEDLVSPVPLPASVWNNSSFLSIVAGGLGAIVPILFTIWTWFNEFPWRGDYNFHLPQSRVLCRSEWVVVIFALWGLLAATFALFQNKRRWAGWAVLVLVAAAIVACELWRPIPPHYARYPATIYVLQTPLFWFASVLGFSESINLNRLFESFALLSWIFLLRPFVLRKKLGWPIVVIVWLLVTQGDTLYYFGGAYLEPWSLIFCLVALEAGLLDGDFRLAFAFIGLAAIVKEQAILLLPFFVLMAWSRERFRCHRFLNLGLWAFFSMLPFLSYFLYRREANVWRTAELASFSGLVNADRIREFVNRVTIQFSTIGTLVLLFLVAALLIGAWVRARRFLIPELFLIAGVLFLPLFFYCDRISASWTGYPRFHLVSFVLLMFLAAHFAFSFRSRTIALALLVFGLAQLPRFTHVWRFHREIAANFFEHYDAPIFLPIRSLFTEAAASHNLTPGSTVQVVELTAFQDLRQFDLGYSDLNARYKVLILPRPPDEGGSFQDPGIRPLWVLAPLIHMANLNAKPSLNLYDHFQHQRDLVRDLENRVISSGGSWSQVRDDKQHLLGFVGYLK